MSFSFVQTDRFKKKEKKTKPTHKTEDYIRNTVTIPYIRGITDRIQRTMKKHRINAAVKLHTKLRQLLAHPKDRIDMDKKCNIIYEIPCKTCHKTYIGETGRSFNTQKTEHKKECEKETTARLTRSQKEKAEQENLKSAISDHCKRNNHVMDWDNSKIIGAESNKFKRWIKEAIEIRRRARTTMNRDEGAFMLSHTWDSLLQKPSGDGGRDRPGRSVRSPSRSRPQENTS